MDYDFALSIVITADGRRDSRPYFSLNDNLGNWIFIILDFMDHPMCWAVVDGTPVSLNPEEDISSIGLDDFFIAWNNSVISHSSVLNILNQMHI